MCVHCLLTIFDDFVFFFFFSSLFVYVSSLGSRRSSAKGMVAVEYVRIKFQPREFDGDAADVSCLQNDVNVIMFQRNDAH